MMNGILIDNDVATWWSVFDSVIYDWFKWSLDDKLSIYYSVIDDSILSNLISVRRSHIEETCTYARLIQYSHVQNLIFVISSWVLHSTIWYFKISIDLQCDSVSDSVLQFVWVYDWYGSRLKIWWKVAYKLFDDCLTGESSLKYSKKWSTRSWGLQRSKRG